MELELQSVNHDTRLAATHYLRPLRLAIVVEPGNVEHLSRAIQLNTCLWGGTFNAIIPNYSQPPNDRLAVGCRSSGNFTNSCLAAFEPDCVVVFNEQKRDISELGQYRCINLATPTLLQLANLGVSVAPVYNEYLTKYRVLMSTQADFKVLWSTDSASDTLTQAFFGSFPPIGWGPFIKQIGELFKPEERVYDIETAVEVCQNRTYPLWIGSQNLYVESYPYKGSSLFILRRDSFDDIVEFWNMRALGYDLIAVPIEWTPGERKRIMTSMAQSLLHFWDGGPLPELNLIYASGLDAATVSGFAESKPAEVKTIVASGMPRWWSEDYKVMDKATRSRISSQDHRIIPFDADQPSLMVHTIGPDFLERGELGSWINVISVPPNDRTDRLGVIQPFMRSEPGSRETFTAGLEGMSIVCNRKPQVVSVSMPSTWSCFERWFKDRNYAISPSPAGQNVVELVQMFGGLSHCNLLKNLDILNFLERLSKSPSMHGGKIISLLTKFTGRQASTKFFQTLVSINALRLGLNVPCSLCRHSNWTRLTDLGENLNCERCLRPYPFPISDPPGGNKAWSYKLQGPMSLANFADGAYSVAVTASFLSKSLEGMGSWYPGVKVSVPGSQPIELDIAMWWSQFGSELEPRTFHHPVLIFGECKTFEAFELVDFERAKRVQQLFPDAIVIFATLRYPVQITTFEREQLTQLAMTARKRWRSDAESHGIALLTANELLSNQTPPSCWSEFDGTGNTRALFSSMWNPIRCLADVTQYLYLGLEPFDVWLTTERQPSRDLPVK